MRTESTRLTIGSLPVGTPDVSGLWGLAVDWGRAMVLGKWSVGTWGAAVVGLVSRAKGYTSGVWNNGFGLWSLSGLAGGGLL